MNRTCSTEGFVHCTVYTCMYHFPFFLKIPLMVCCWRADFYFVDNERHHRKAFDSAVVKMCTSDAAKWSHSCIVRLVCVWQNADVIKLEQNLCALFVDRRKEPKLKRRSWRWIESASLRRLKVPTNASSALQLNRQRYVANCCSCWQICDMLYL